MNTGFGVIGIPAFCHRIFRSFVSNHLPPSRRFSGLYCVRLTGPRCAVTLRAMRHFGFASSQQAATVVGDQFHLRYGLIVHLRLLSTSPRGDAVTFSYKCQSTAAETFTLLIHAITGALGQDSNLVMLDTRNIKNDKIGILSHELYRLGPTRPRHAPRSSRSGREHSASGRDRTRGCDAPRDTR